MVLHRGAMLKRIYEWCIDAAHKPYALWIMGAVAFAESSFFPVPREHARYVRMIPRSGTVRCYSQNQDARILGLR